ncbi:metallophosphoesterase [Chloroflexia bacterium SDU3-3]|nr:metallophosphoesterase [Chloroflexia bacterium SDU3-3]
MLVEPYLPVLTRQTFVLPDLPAALDGLRIGHLSDAHIGARGAEQNLRWAIAQMRREQPELVAFTGDFIHEPPTVHLVSGLLRDLSAPLGVYAIPGNHDYWESVTALRVALGDCGIPLLMNEHRRITWRGGELWLVGTDDVWDGTPDLDAALAGVPADGFKLLLAHTPHDAPAAASRGVALQLSGHTHGGHMRLPLLGPFATPRYTDAYVGGRYQVGQLWLYVSRGLSGMGIRLGCRPEATIITLRRAG